MKIILFVVTFFQVTFIFRAEAQRYNEIGGFGGASYYLGDINVSSQFYDSSPSFGILYRFVMDKRESFRIDMNYGQFRASDKDFNNAYQQAQNISFSASLLQANVLYEFNFLPFAYYERRKTFSPYIFGGLAYNFILQSQYNIGNHISVPFGMGLKYKYSRRITVGVEWCFQKTFEDGIDGVVSPGGSQYNSPLINTDWYCFAGFFISFRLFDNSDCPVYQ